jgi:hypothetical protein
LQRHNEGLVAQAAVLDLRNRSLPRGAEPNPTEAPLVVNHAARHWNIYLPLGSTEGTYEIRIVTNTEGLLLTATGEATLASGIATLPVVVNLGSRRPIVDSQRGWWFQTAMQTRWQVQPVDRERLLQTFAQAPCRTLGSRGKVPTHQRIPTPNTCFSPLFDPQESLQSTKTRASSQRTAICPY